MSVDSISQQTHSKTGQEQAADATLRELRRETPVKERWITKYTPKTRDIDRLKKELAGFVAELSKLKRKERVAVLAECGLQERLAIVAQTKQPLPGLQPHALPPDAPEYLPPSQKRVASLTREELEARREKERRKSANRRKKFNRPTL